MDPDRIVTATYVNWRGETQTRRFVPLELFWGASEWHPEPQHLLKAYDLDRRTERTFAMSGFVTPWSGPPSADAPADESQELSREREPVAVEEADQWTPEPSPAVEDRVADQTVRGSGR